MSVVETVLVLFDVEFFVLFFAQVLRTGGPTPTTFSRSLRTLVPLSPHLLQSPATNPHSQQQQQIGIQLETNPDATPPPALLLGPSHSQERRNTQTRKRKP